MSRSITLLRSFGPRLAKTFTRRADGSITSEPYGNAARFTGTIRQFDDIGGLYSILREASQDRRTCVIPGAPRPGANLSRLNRRKAARPGQPAPDIIDAPHGVAWARLDIDSLPAPRSSGLLYGPDGKAAGVSSPQQLVKDVILTHLPDYLHGVSVIYQFTSSAGVYTWDEVRLGLWYVLERPLTHRQLRVWADALGVVDAAVFSANQCNYTADPVFVNMPDPCAGWRWGLISEGWQ